MFLNEISARLQAQGVGTVGLNIFMGSKAKLPALGESGGQGPFITLIETGGMMPLFVHNELPPHVQRPTAQVTARATSYMNARNMISAAYNALHVWNTTLSGVRYIKIVARQEPTDFGLDAEGRVKIGFNIDVEKARS